MGVAIPMALVPVGVAVDGVIMVGVAPPCGVRGVPESQETNIQLKQRTTHIERTWK